MIDQSSCISDWIFSGKDWFFATVGSAIGFIVGILWARFEVRRSFEERREPVKNELVHALNKGLEHINTAKNILAGRALPNFTLDVSLLVRAIDRASEFISEDTLHELDSARFQMEHASNKMVNLYHASLTCGVGRTMEHSEVRSLLDHFAMIENSIRDAISRVRSDTSKPVPPILPF